MIVDGKQQPTTTSMADDENINRLTRQLEGIRLQREEALRQLEQTSQAEQVLIQRIRAARRGNPALRRNPHKVGDIVRITNTLRDEYGTIGVVESSPHRLVTIRNQDTGTRYIRGWWNLEPVVTPSIPTTTRRINANPNNNSQ